MRQDTPIQGSGLLFPLLIAVGTHLLGFWLLWFGWQQASTISEQRMPKINPEDIISAVAVQQDPIEAMRQKQRAQDAAKAKARAEQERRRQQELQRQAEARKQALIRQREEEARQKELERKRQEAAAKREADRKAAEEAKKQAELKRQQQLKAEQAKKAGEARKQEEIRKREAQLAAAKEQKAALAAAEAERKRKEAIEAEKRSLQAALDEEEAFLSQLEDRERLASMQMLIKSYVEQNWSRPPTARKGMQAVLKIELLPTGEVKSVNVIESSKDSAFDRSAEQAVYRAGPFRELQDLKPHQRDAFRSFNLVFKPEDIQ
ncbi:cell envelope integrity protein TolA [Oceanospirillum sanctuarii]|uniref:cell envelope integrity protein TolA n=1 Tax=Oceanospirillum sanctuarii TaxID=1434821 RepID=UPI000A3C92CB|nr:cell envelope integrity protein TolA [Oceanospirillum sanctuarii]